MVRRTSMLTLLAVLLMFPARSWAASKGTATAPNPGACQVTLRDFADDVIRSDNGGPYVDGAGGVVCNVVQDPTRVNYGWLYLSFSSNRTKRYLVYPGQATDADGLTGYSGFNSHGTFEVKGMAKIQWQGSVGYYDIEPFRANVEIGQFSGDSNWTGPATGSASVFVMPLDDGCTWKVWSDPTAGGFSSPTGLGDATGTRTAPRVIELRKQQGASWITQGMYAMPFGATVKLIAKPSCN